MNVNHKRLEALVSAVCVAAGTGQEEAGMVASHLVEANLKGHDSHGVGMLPTYIHNIGAGHLKPNQHAAIVSDVGSTIVVEGGFGYGQVVGREAMDLGIVKAKDAGVAVVALRNAHHLGRIGSHAERVVSHGLISMHYVNVVGHAPQVAPFGGIEKRLSTNPFCCAIPVAGEQPIVLDMATSAIAAGKVRVARNSGQLVPEGCLIDKDGHETRDPNLAAAQVHFGKHKGFGLALICEILAGALTGAWSIQPGNPREGTVVNHMLTFILDPAVIGDTDKFQQELKALMAYVKDTPPAPDGDGVMLPGEPERTALAARASHGIEIDETSWSQIVATAASVGLDDARVSEFLGHD